MYFVPSTSDAPNNRLPILHYQGVLPEPLNEDTATEFLSSNKWEKRGTWGHIGIRHFHPNSHECYGLPHLTRHLMCFTEAQCRHFPRSFQAPARTHPGRNRRPSRRAKGRRHCAADGHGALESPEFPRLPGTTSSPRRAVRGGGTRRGSGRYRVLGIRSKVSECRSRIPCMERTSRWFDCSSPTSWPSYR